jgi:hypothetical protein
MDVISVVKNDTGTDLTTTLTRSSSGDAFDASGADVALKIRKKNTNTTIMSIPHDPDKSNRPGGTLVFSLEPFLTNSSITEGFYEAEVEFSLADNKILTAFELINIKVRNDFNEG